MRWVASVVVLLALGACPPAPVVPGTEVIGAFGLRAVPAERACELEEVSGAPFEFDATLSRDADAGAAWLTLQATSREAVWDGQLFTSSASARRLFSSRCAACATFLDETLSLAVLSRTQSERAGSQCPDGPLDGGVPAPDPDAGVFGPAMTPLGFDAVRACGELVTAVRSEGLTDGGACEPECSACVVRYRVTGARK